MTPRILVINPNSSADVTREVDNALAALRLAGGPVIDCTTLKEGPPAIETQRHSDEVVAPLCGLIERESERTSAFIVACFSDPGLHAAREVSARPVFGIAESGILMALALGNRFGIISILETSIPRHARYLRSMGVDNRLAGDIAIGLGVTDLQDEKKTLGRMSVVAQRLRDQYGASVLIMGCAGMANYRTRLEREIGLPVVDPTQAAVGFALAAVNLDYRHAWLGPGKVNVGPIAEPRPK